MADQHELSKLLAEFQTEVNDLEKRQKQLTQSCNTLEAKKVYLESKVKKLTDTSLQAEEKATSSVKTKTDELVAVEVKLTANQKTLENLERKAKEAESTLATAIKDTEIEVIRRNKLLNEKKQELTALEGIVAGAEQELQITHENMAVAAGNLATLDAEIEQTKVEHNELIKELNEEATQAHTRISGLNKQILNTENELKNLQNKVASARSELAEVAKQKAAFKDYETKARGALAAHESAIMERERQLDIQIVTSRRRHGVLDNLD